VQQANRANPQQNKKSRLNQFEYTDSDDPSIMS
jgi:hypothetical protein